MAALKLSWTRPADIPYPMTWTTFKAKDVDTDDLVDYEIRDLTMDRFDESFDILTNDYLRNEPMNMAMNCADDPEIVARFRARCLSSMNQKTAIACFKVNTNEIAGINMVMVHRESDNIGDQIKAFAKAENERVTYDAQFSLYSDFDVYDYYKVDELLTCCGLSVPQKYQGRAIGLKLLQARALLAKAYGIKIGHSDFSSNYSIPIALKAGFKIDRERTYKQLYEQNPRFNFGNIGHDKLVLMTWVFAN